jgi:hypothetical protein
MSSSPASPIQKAGAATPAANRWTGIGYSVLFCAASMSVGWRIRGQFGHEIGAAIAGALGAMAVVLASCREDWWRRVHYFALLGALGWSFGGSISYMKVISFTHSSDSATVFYGFAAMFLIGFLWSALGGAGTALSAALDNEQLARLFPALVMVLAAWFLQAPLVDWYQSNGGTLLDWYDSDWLSAAVALVAALVLVIVRRRIDEGTSLVLHLAIGWWVGFLLLVNVLGLRINPPRGDNWAGCVGVLAGLLAFCWRWRLPPVAYAALATGTLGGAGFCLGQMLRLAGAYSHSFASMHVTLEWLQGMFFGMALALGMARMVRCQPIQATVALPRWTGIVAIFFVLWVIPYLNACRVPDRWMRDGNFPASVQGMHAVGGFVPSHGWIGWVELLFLPLGVMMLLLCARQARRPLPFLPPSWLGRAQLLYLAFLWAFALISFTIAISRLQPRWFVIQWAITLHILACTWLLMVGPTSSRKPEIADPPDPWPIRRLAMASVLIAATTAVSGWGLKRAMFGDSFAGAVNVNHIRFGSQNTNDQK